MTSKKKNSAGAASFFGRKKKSANEEKNGKAFPKTAGYRKRQKDEGHNGRKAQENRKV